MVDSDDTICEESDNSCQTRNYGVWKKRDGKLGAWMGLRRHMNCTRRSRRSEGRKSDGWREGKSLWRCSNHGCAPCHKKNADPTGKNCGNRRLPSFIGKNMYKETVKKTCELKTVKYLTADLTEYHLKLPWSGCHHQTMLLKFKSLCPHGIVTPFRVFPPLLLMWRKYPLIGLICPFF